MQPLTRRLGALLATATAAVVTTTVLAPPAQALTLLDTDEVTLLVHSSARLEKLRDLLDGDGRVVAAPTLRKIDVTRVKVPASVASLVQRYLETQPEIAEVERAVPVAAFGEDEYRFAQDYLDRMQVPAAWATTRGTAETVIAVIDTGVRADHVELAGKLLPGYDVVNDDADPADDNGHGTAVASLAGAVTDNDTGIAAVCPECAVLPVKVLDANGDGLDSDVAEGIVWATDRGADVINLSLGSTTATDTLRAAVDYAHDKGVILVAAAGNSGTTTPTYPAAYPHVTSVAAINEDGTLAASSNYGATVDVAARYCVPAVAWNGSPTDINGLCGTSAAAPQVAGIAALLRTADPSADTDGVERALKATATPQPGGIGEPNALAALAEDMVSPTVQITAPGTGAAVKGTVTVTADAADNTGVTGTVARVEFFDGTTSLGTDTTAPYTASWATGTVTRTATLTAVATDGAGNDTTSKAAAPVVDLTLPTATITAPAEAATVAGTVPVTVTATDNVAVARVDVYNGATWLGVAPSGSDGTYVLPVDTTGYVDGTALALKAKVADTAGNVRYTLATTVTVDNTRPTVTLADPSAGAPIRGTIALTADAADNVAVKRVEFFDGTTLLGTDTTAPYSINWATTGAGASSLTAVAYDAAGNKTTSTGVPVTVDNVLPTAAFLSPANGATVTGLVTFTVKAEDNLAVAKVDLFDGTTFVTTSTTAPYTLTWDSSKAVKGSHTMKIKVTDTAGNVRYAQVILTVA